MSRKFVLLVCFVLLVGMAGLGRADTLFHWQFEGSEEDPIAYDIDIVSGEIAYAFVNESGVGTATGLFYGEANPWFNSGGTSADFQNDPNNNNRGYGLAVLDGGVDSPVDLSTLSQVTIEAFCQPHLLRQGVIIRKNNSTGDGGIYYIDARPTGHFAVRLAGPNDDITDSGAVCNDLLYEIDEWYHVALVWDGSVVKFYVNGVKSEDLTGSSEVPFTGPIGDSCKALGIGCQDRACMTDPNTPTNTNQMFYGKIDEVRISDEALAPSQFLIFGGGQGVATRAKPSNGARNVCPDSLVLSWKPGPDAGDLNGHDVYFGTNYDDVKNAGTSTAGIYKGRQDSNSYPEVGSLSVDIGATYYWRIDEVNEAGEPDDIWEGGVWTFTIEDGNASEPSPPNGVKGVNPNVVLSWTPACVADSHNVYLGTVYSDVLNGAGGTSKGNRTDPNYDPGGLAQSTTYYWRIAEVDGGNTYPGEVWSFKTGKGGVIVYFDFDGTEGQNLPGTITDETATVTFTKYLGDDPCGTVKYGPANPFYNMSGTSASFTPEAGFYRLDPNVNNTDILRLDGVAYTIEMWIKPDSISYDNTALMKKYNAWQAGLDGDHFEFRHREDPLDGDEQLALGEWTHVAAVFDLLASSDQKKIYINGVLDNAEDATQANPADNNAPVAIGFMRRANGTSDDFVDGQIDELAILDIALGPGTFLFYPGLEWANDPNPYSGQTRVDPNVVLSWTAGLYANSHDVYLGTDANVLYLGNTDVNHWPEVGNLELQLGTGYYWRVDEIGDSNTWKGLVWRFTVRPKIEDPNLMLWYKLDETDGDQAADSSGYENHGNLEGDDNWDPEDGRFGGSLIFEDDTRIEAPVASTATITSQVTIAVWLKNSDRPLYDNWVFGIGSSSNTPYQIRAAVPLVDGYNIEWRAGNDTNDVIQWDMRRIGLDPGRLDGWHLWAFVKDEDAGNIRLYFDGERVDSNDTVDPTVSQQYSRFRIGGVSYHGNDLVAKMDDFRMYDRALSDAEVAALFRGGELELAWDPNPLDGSSDVRWDANLTWQPGDYTDTHDVYFGTSWDDVNSATTVDRAATKNLGDEEYDPGAMELGQTYYWRIDEVNEPNTYKGRVWSFTVAEYVTLDDFEQYDLDQKQIQYEGGWYDQYSQEMGQTTGAWLELAQAPRKPVYRGVQAMSYTYDTDDIWADLNYAEAWLPLEESGGFQDWTSVDVRLLTVFFYGQAGNDATEDEQMYVAVDDTFGTYAEIRYGDNEGEALSDIQVEEWQRWDIPFVYFSDGNFAAVPDDVEFSSIRNVYIGFGNRRSPVAAGKGIVFFDDLLLSMPICKPEFGPVGDLDDDCVIGMGDVRVMGAQWLDGDVDVSPVTEPSDANRVARWQLDGNANDSWPNAYHGTAEGAYEWVAGKDGQAIDLSGGWVVVDDNGVTPKLRPKHYVSVMAWIYLDGEVGSNERVVIKGRNDHETFGLEADDSDGAVFIMRDANNPGSVLKVNSGIDAIGDNEWIHVAGTYDQNEQLIYVNGVVEDSNARGAIELFADANDGLGIGGRYPASDTSGRFEGKIDDVRVYDRAVSRAEIAWLASGGDGVVDLVSEANLYIDDPAAEIINFKDFAKLLESWGVEQLWPPQPAP
ncbi:MAG TPA: LamG domain-containing protein [Sedimentisphaerales bacterium]|nr:LamG domain-containing protein [Sedimentisphaerales bacterium]